MEKARLVLLPALRKVSEPITTLPVIFKTSVSFCFPLACAEVPSIYRCPKGKREFLIATARTESIKCSSADELPLEETRLTFQRIAHRVSDRPHTRVLRGFLSKEVLAESEPIASPVSPAGAVKRWLWVNRSAGYP